MTKNTKTETKEVEKRAAIYCRVSTIMQGAADYSSLDAQEDQLKAFCKGKGWEVAEIYKDTKSGATLDRDELNKMLVDAESGKFNVIVVTKIDRLSRSMMDFKNITKQFDDLIVYDNQPDGRLGLDRCYEDCKGYCVEYGLTGSAYCFPVNKPVEKDFNGMIVSNDQKLSFPNVL